MKRLTAAAFLLFSTLSAFAQAAPAQKGSSLWTMIREGGWAMWPLGLCSLLMFFFIFYAWRETMRKRFIPDASLPEISVHLGNRNIDAARQTLSTSDTVLGRSLAKALSKARPELPGANREKVETLLIECLEAEENTINRPVNYLNVIAATAPMIGLLGTVSGMIGAFQTMERIGMGQPQAFAGSIGEALITTASGLVIGIPAMVAYFVMRNRLSARMIATAQCATDLVDELAGEAGA
ncbi:MotA/TolQ/ExbB proton channel family protein [Ruficoccus amylovorans]|uniref:MotA/TolQ/ExbB proton channel family protein n=1 Tax=Ruficoccus amylovorans TaxID=1804625 RepID=A0A842HHT6_9BACT|nr:MotA/TolQ/ExbB proton channel family protein [Ruficoccus amylovorans]MBC2595558.1 MotA/TolQ/ExbB proton channel family protein [Ruficoccus amylovorans]